MIGHESSDVIEGGTSHGGAGSGNSSATCAVFPHTWAVIIDMVKCDSLKRDTWRDVLTS